MRYYKCIVKVPEDEGVSVQKRKDGTFVVYKHKEHVTEPVEKDLVRTCTIGRMPLERIPQMYPNDNYGKLYPDYAKFLNDDMAFPEEFWLEPGIFVFLKRSAEMCGLMEVLRSCFEDEDTVNEIMDLAVYLAYSGNHSDNLDEYLKEAPLMTDDWYDGEKIMKRIRGKVQIRQIREFVKKWAAKQAKDFDKNPDVYLYLDTSFWGRLFRGMFSLTGSEARLRDDVKGPKGNLPPLNFILALRCPDGMPLFYKDTGFDASVDIYDAGAALAKKYKANRFTFLLKDPDVLDSEIARLDAAGYDYIFHVQDNLEMCVECYSTINGEDLFFFTDPDGDAENGDEENNILYARSYIREPFTLCAQTETTYGSRKGWMYVYFNMDDEKGDEDAVDDFVRLEKDRAEKCIGKTMEELAKDGRTPETFDYVTFTWGKKNGKEAVLSYEVDDDAVETKKYLAGVTCYFTTTEGMAEYAAAFVEDANYYGSIIECGGLNTRDSMSQLSSDEDLGVCWKDRNNEIESFIKFVACILLHTMQKAAEDSGLTANHNDGMMSVYSVSENLSRITATRGKRGKFRLEYPLDYTQEMIFEAIGMTVEDFMKEMEKAGDAYVRRTLPW